MENIKIAELFTYAAQMEKVEWQKILNEQQCPFLGKKCIKIRKSQPEISIGTCTVKYGKTNREVIICPHRLLENRKIFLDCIHLLTLHEPGNELHIVPEISIPGGSIDYFLVSARDGKVKDFIGIELQTLDTTGTVCPERQRFLKNKGLEVNDTDYKSEKPFGMNWKMTAKTTLIQLHHKIQTFEHLSKHLVLVLQDCLMEYVRKQFDFSHVALGTRLGDSMHFHAYELVRDKDQNFSISLKDRFSTDGTGIAKCLGLQAESKVELEKIVRVLEAKISQNTMVNIV